MADRGTSQARFLAFMEAGFDREHADEITDAFVGSFREGDLVSDYAAILAKSEGCDRHDDIATYYWIVPLPRDPKRVDSTQRRLSVMAIGNPAKIDMVRSADSVD